jgi:uncharacterized protein
MNPVLVPVLVLGVVALSALLVVTAVAWVASERALRPKQSAEEHTFHAFGLDPEDVTFPSRDGLVLSGSFLPGTKGAAVIFCHGWGRAREELIPHAAHLHRAGFACLLFDQRSRGHSEGEFVTIGGLERFDVIGAADWLSARPDVDSQRIGVFGVSGGAAAAVLAAAEDQRLRALAIESCYRNIHSVVAQSFKHFIGLPSFPFAHAAVKVCEVRIGQSAAVLAPERVVATISPRPILFIHGLADHSIDHQASVHMHGLAGDPKDLWLIEEAGHARGIEVADAEYERRLVEFFSRSLTGGSGDAPDEARAGRAIT